jgi:acyl-CoA reductase-like NAD-dependent aldehyde dehydrogenase
VVLPLYSHKNIALTRGEIVRKIGDAQRANLHQLGRLLSQEMGEIRPEGIGVVQVKATTLSPDLKKTTLSPV